MESELTAKGLDVLVDDRDERPGIKFKDADLLGMPLRLVIGKKAIDAGEVELVERRTKAMRKIKPAGRRAGHSRGAGILQMKKCAPFRNPVVVALDVDTRDEALRLVNLLGDMAGGFKVGPRLCLREGESLCREIAAKAAAVHGQ